MRTLTIADNWKDWKFGDTDAVMTLTATDDGKTPDFGNKTLTFKIANTANNDLEQPEDFAATAPGYINGNAVQLKTEDVKQLTPGNYVVELWVMDNDTHKDAIYPSKGFAQFTIEENSMKVSDITNISSMTLNAFWDALMQKVSTLTKGAKGDPGQTPKIVMGSVTKLSPDAQPSATLVPLQSDPNTYTLNLQLPQGVQGEQGLQGIPGVGSKGLDGNNGLTPTIDPKTKHWMIGGTDTGVIAEGQAGKNAGDIDFVSNNQEQRLDNDDIRIKDNQTKIENIEGVGSLKDIELTDQNGNHLTDNSGVRIGGKRWLIDTDKTLTQADLPADAKAVGEALITYGNRASNHEVRLGIHDFRLNNHEQRLGDDDIRIKDNQTRVENIEGVGSLKDIELTDQDGNYLTDGSGVRIGGKRWLINTDKTLTQADLPADAKAVGEALVTKPDNYDLPILYLYGAGIEGMKSKKDSLSEGLSFSFPRFNVSGTLTGIKVQGASSASLAKKNYTLHLDRKIELIPGYGKQKKYVIKADMTDFSHVRNVGCAKLWGEVRKTRIKADDAIKVNDTDYLTDNAGNHITGEADPQLSIGGNYGAVDGFPIALYINDKYWGLYTFNVPKDDWMAKMPKKQGCAIVSTTWMSFTEHTKLDDTDMGLEYCGTKDSTWVTDAVNRLIDTVKASYNTKDDFTNAVTPYLDLDSAIDYYVYSVAIGNVDGVVRNFNLQTWDGKKWYFAAYDLDMVFGRTPDLLDYLSPEYNGSSIRRGGITFENLSGGNRIFHQLWKFYQADIIARYKELVQSVLSVSNMSTFLTNYAKSMPIALKIQEDKLWPQTPLTDTNNLEQIRWWYMLHINFLNNLVANA